MPEEAKKSAEELNQQKIRTLLAQYGGKTLGEDSILRGGTKIQLPNGMSYDDAARVLKNVQKAEDEPTTFHKKLRYRPFDGAAAAARVFKNHFGVVIGKATDMGFFGSIPPRVISVAVGPNETIQVPWGSLAIPALPGAVFDISGTYDDEDGEVFMISCESPRKWRAEIEGVFRLIEDELKAHSIYRGKAIDGRETPNFLDIDSIDSSKVVYSEELMTQLDVNLWSIMRMQDVMKEHDIPLRRSVLFEGSYGNGKTLAILLTAKIASANGWTFIQCRAGEDDWNRVMQTAVLYQPSVVAFEDVDVLASSSDDKVGMSQILDKMDGMTAKGRNMICVFTTNHPDKIHRGMMRPGRLDAVMHFGQLDITGIEKLIRILIPAENLEADINFVAIHEACRGFQPAFVKEAIDRAKRYALVRSGGLNVMSTEDFIYAANGLRPQLEMMEGSTEHIERTQLEQALLALFGTGIRETMFNRIGGDSAPDRSVILRPQNNLH